MAAPISRQEQEEALQWAIALLEPLALSLMGQQRLDAKDTTKKLDGLRASLTTLKWLGRDDVKRQLGLR